MRPNHNIPSLSPWLVGTARVAYSITIGAAAALIIVPWVITGALYRYTAGLIESRKLS